MVTVSGQTFQMSSQYSAMARSDENLPLRAVFRMDILVQDSLSCHAATVELETALVDDGHVHLASGRLSRGTPNPRSGHETSDRSAPPSSLA